MSPSAPQSLRRYWWWSELLNWPFSDEPTIRYYAKMLAEHYEALQREEEHKMDTPTMDDDGMRIGRDNSIWSLEFYESWIPMLRKHVKKAYIERQQSCDVVIIHTRFRWHMTILSFWSAFSLSAVSPTLMQPAMLHRITYHINLCVFPGSFSQVNGFVTKIHSANALITSNQAHSMNPLQRFFSTTPGPRCNLQKK